VRLLFIRHGQTPCNVSGKLDTSYPGAGLTSLGRAQAAAVPAALADERITSIYATPLLRTQLTAAPLAHSWNKPASPAERARVSMNYGGSWRAAPVQR